VGRRAYLEHLRGLVYGDDPRQGYVEAGRYVAPQLGLELAFPAGWKVQCSHAAAQGQDPQGQAALQASLAADAGTASPGEFVAALTRDGRIAASQGGSETPGGWPAWVGRVVVPAQGGGGATLDAAFVRLAPDRLLELLGQSAAPGDADDRAIFAAIRSLRPLEPARAHPEPMRVKLVACDREGAFSAVLPGLGGSAVGVTEASIMNGLAADDAAVHPGQLLKLVEPGRRK
jgi:predicted Zn-dependent protease